MSKNEEDYLDRLLNSVTHGGTTEEDSFLEDSFDKVESMDLSSDFESLDDLFHVEEDDFIKNLEAELGSESADRYLAEFEAELTGKKHSSSREETDGDDALSRTSEKPKKGLSGFFGKNKKGNKESKEEKVVEQENLDSAFSEEYMKDSSGLGREALGTFMGQADLSEVDSLPSEELASEELPLEELPSEDLSAEDLISGALDHMSSLVGNDEEEPLPVEEDSLGSSVEELPLTEDGEADLAGNSDDDLMSLLSGEGDLSDLGSLLSADESDAPLDGEDSIGDFAAREMAEAEKEAEAEEDLEEENKGKKGRRKKKGDKKNKGEDEENGEKKPGFFKKLLSALFKEPEEEMEIPLELTGDGSVDIQELSDENMQILRELEAAEGGGAAPAEEASAEDGKKKKKKEKKEKPKKEKKEKPKKEKKPPKEKKPRKPFFNDNSPKLPLVPCILIFILVGSMAALLYIAVELGTYETEVKEAKAYYVEGTSDYKNYILAYNTLAGVTIKEEDSDFYLKLEILAEGANALRDFEAFHSIGDEEAALDNLICVIGRIDLNYDQAEALECLPELNSIEEQALSALKSIYGMSKADALEIYSCRTRKEYSKQLYLKLVELGLE